MEPMRSSCSRGRSLLRCAYVDQEGTIKIYTVYGALLTSDAVLCALQKREHRRRQRSTVVTADDLGAVRAYKEPTADLKRLRELVTRRAILSQRMNESGMRRWTLAMRRSNQRLGEEDYRQGFFLLQVVCSNHFMEYYL